MKNKKPYSPKSFLEAFRDFDFATQQGFKPIISFDPQKRNFYCWWFTSVDFVKNSMKQEIIRISPLIKY